MALKPISQLPGKTWMDEPVFKYIIKKYNIKSMFDMGCGQGGVEKFAKKYNVSWVGVDGDKRAITKNPHTIIHDYRTGSFLSNENYFDLCWSIEFLEHLEEQYVLNVLNDFSCCKYLVVTAHPPPPIPRKNKSNGWHVNEQHPEYWIKKITNIGFSFLEKDIEQIKKKCVRTHKNWIKRHGLFFINKGFINKRGRL